MISVVDDDASVRSATVDLLDSVGLACEPFPLRDGYVEFWRASSGHHFCSEFCADDAEEAQFVKSHVTEAVGTSSVNGSTPL